MVPPTPPTGDTTCLDESLEEEGESLLSGVAVSPQRQKMVEKVEKTIRDLLQSEKGALQVWGEEVPVGGGEGRGGGGERGRGGGGEGG